MHALPHSSRADTLVLTHDSCYGHRFSRLRTPKTVLSSIVERPERQQAGMLGVAAAYVRLGRRHAGGEHEPRLEHEPSLDVPFRLRKVSNTVQITSPIVAAVHGAKWMQELKAMCQAAEEKLANGRKELTRPDTPTGVNPQARADLHEGDLYLSKESIDAFEGALGAVCEAVEAVFSKDEEDYQPCKKAFVCIRPPGHHCSADWPSGFCWINNVHVGIEHAIQMHGLTHAAIIDFDLHHGDGSQAIAWERNARSLKAQKSTAKNAAFKRSSVGYFSLHDINSYPCEDGDPNKVQRASVCIENAHGQNIWNTHLQPWSTEQDFWQHYEQHYRVLLDKMRAYLKRTTERLRSTNAQTHPRAAIFISAGFDASEWETPSMQRHKVNVPTEFYARFTSDIVKIAEEEGTSVEGRVVSVLEGGYSDRAITSGVFSHIAGLASSSTTHVDKTKSATTPTDLPWDPEWWSSSSLKDLEDLKGPVVPKPPAPVKKPVLKELPTYQTPTQSFTAKVVDPSKLSRHTSINTSTPPKSRPTTPPPPEVNWAVATDQLSRLLVPSETRQVDSCKHEELKEPRKKERHSSIGIQPLNVEQQGERMQTRGRRARLHITGEIDSTNRRRTISELPTHTETDMMTEEKDSEPVVPTAQSSTAPSMPQAKSRVATSRRPDAAKPPRPRRVSGGKEVGPSVMSRAPPVPQLPSTEIQSSASNSVAVKDMDDLAANVSKIELALPGSQIETQTASEAIVASRKTSRKPAALRTAKVSVPKKSTTGKSAVATQPVSKVPTVERKSSASTTQSDATGTKNLVPKSKDIPAVTTNANAQMEPFTTVTPATVATESKNGMTSSTVSSMDPPTSNYFSKSIADDAVLDGIEGGGQTDTNQEGDNFIHYYPHGQGAQRDTPAESNFHQEPLQWLPPNASTPPKVSASRGKENLPVFTANGRIPFPTAVSENGNNVESDTGSASSTVQGSRHSSGNPHPDSSHWRSAEIDVWNVPVTPRKS